MRIDLARDPRPEPALAGRRHAAVALPALQPLMRSLWSLTYAESRGALPGMVAPDAHVEFVFQTGATCAIRTGNALPVESPRAMVYGLRHGMLRLQPTGPNTIVAFRSSAAVASRLLGRPLAGCWDRPLALSEFIGREADELLGRIALAPSHALHAIVESWLTRRLSGWGVEDAREAALQAHLFWHFTDDRVARFAKQLGVSVRTLRRRCAASAGLSPKQLVTSGRMLRACILLREQPELSISEVAVRLGFSDQAALANALHNYFGLAPSELRAEPVVFYERPGA